VVLRFAIQFLNKQHAGMQHSKSVSISGVAKTIQMPKRNRDSADDGEPLVKDGDGVTVYDATEDMPKTPSKSAYEMQREENIRQNKKLMVKLKMKYIYFLFLTYWFENLEVLFFSHFQEHKIKCHFFQKKK